MAAYVIWNEKSKMNLSNRMKEGVSKQELESALRHLREIHSIEMREVKHDINSLERKIDKVLDKLLGT